MRPLLPILKDLGFEVFELFDADAFAMGRAAESFLRAARAADLALFYFAGHGVQLFDRNFLLARDVDPFAASTPADPGIDLTAFMDKLRRAGPIRQALLIDACRDNPLTFDATITLLQRLQGPGAAPTAELARNVKRSGLASIALPRQSTGAETLVFFAAQPGSASYDGSGQNSYFAEGLKEGLADPARPLMEIFRQVSAYVRTATNGNQIPQVVSDWTSDIALGAREAAKVTYNIFANNDKRALTKPEEELLIRSSSAYTRFRGDFIVRASVGNTENFDLTEVDKKRAKDLGSINGLSIVYDLDRDGRDEVLHVYFRQTNYVLVVEKEGVWTEVDSCFGGDEVTDVEIALRDINGDRRPEVWIAYDTGSNWSTFCILEFRGIPDLENRRRGNTGMGFAGTKVFRTLLRGGAGWGVTVGNDNRLKACAGSNCHSPASYAFDGERFRLLSSELDDDVGVVKDRPFRDEKERAGFVYAAYRQAAKSVTAECSGQRLVPMDVRRHLLPNCRLTKWNLATHVRRLAQTARTTRFSYARLTAARLRRSVPTVAFRMQKICLLCRCSSTMWRAWRSPLLHMSKLTGSPSCPKRLTDAFPCWLKHAR
jgi:hypothetical protein